MNESPLILVFDIGKTNKKLFLYSDRYEIVHQLETRIPEIKDEDGDPCEDLQSLTTWIRDSFDQIIKANYSIKALNFSAYGASFVNIDANGNAATPLYNYLKAFPENLHNEFYQDYGGVEQFCLETASPDLGNLNSGLQLYRIKKQKPKVFEKIKHSLHLPQYISWLFTNKPYSDITSIGCHTALWNFQLNQYHRWVVLEGIAEKLADIFPSDKVINFGKDKIVCGVGLHDSSAALIPYLRSFTEPFVLISTGTWCISLNPFNQTPLNFQELGSDCLCYLDYRGKSVKASRLFAGNEHENSVKQIADRFQVNPQFYREMRFDKEISNKLKTGIIENAVDAYYDFMIGLVNRQVESTNLVLNGSDVKDIFVDGGFSKNQVYMNLLAEAYPDKKVWAATVAQSTALGAALAIHSEWNKNEIPSKLVDRILFKPEREISKL